MMVSFATERLSSFMGLYLSIFIYNNYYYFVNKLLVLVFIYINYIYLTTLVIYYYLLYYIWLQV